MIDRLRLQNFRGFEDHTVPFRDLTVLVGANNTGKSTIVEALRLIAIVVDRLGPGAKFLDPPEWLPDPAPTGVAPSVRGLPTGGFEQTLFHRY